MFGRRTTIPPQSQLKQETKNAMSIEKPIETVEKKFKNTVSLSKPNKVGQVIYNGNDLKFHICVKGPFSTEVYPTPPIQPQSVLFRYIVPQVAYRKRLLVIKETTYCIANWTGDAFPNVIYVTQDNTDGYIDELGITTNRVAAMQLTQFIATMDDAEQRTYDLKYEIKAPVSWTVDERDFIFRLQIDGSGSAAQLPLQNPISLNFEIRTQ